VPNIVIVGGGLTGLAAAWELEQRGVEYTLIEVKRRLGGSIITERRDGFVLDGGAFIVEKYGDWPFLAELGLDDALIPLGRYRTGELVAFKDGTQTLIDALASRLTAPIMTRMAVSSVGQIKSGVGSRYGVCLENGLMLDARGLIITAPARYAEHMLRALAPEAAIHLLDYEYDPVVRVSLGYPRSAVHDLPAAAPPFKFIEGYALPGRVPPDYVLVRGGVRLGEEIDTPAKAAEALKTYINAGDPMMEWTAYWPEMDSLMLRLPEHLANMDAIDALLPPDVALVGSDYRARCLDQRVAQGRAAAARVADFLRG
jgi:protoporphyrinogen oxidase